jgi:5'-3' exonuclease
VQFFPFYERSTEPLKAPGEAEAELAYLNSIGTIDAILSDDVDNFLFGAKTVIRKCALANNSVKTTLLFFSI